MVSKMGTRAHEVAVAGLAASNWHHDNRAKVAADAELLDDAGDESSMRFVCRKDQEDDLARCTLHARRCSHCVFRPVPAHAVVSTYTAGCEHKVTGSLEW